MKTFIRFVEVKSLADLAWWRNTAEPAIRALPDRSDREWRWDRIFWSTSLAGKLRNPRIVKAVVDAADGTEVTVGVGAFLRCEVFVGNPDKTAAFTWYLSTLPNDLSRNLLARESPKGVGRAMIEYVVRLAMHDGHDGRHWLHADRGGGPRLMDFYQKKCMMLPHDPAAAVPKWFRPNDGRYFFHDEGSSFYFLREMARL